ncbi:MAG: repeat protein, partial [Planctomycetaceae bacterium]|nr:repeat protein [Planctomycetaceae bacterium]
MKKIPMTSWLQNMFGGAKRSPKKRQPQRLAPKTASSAEHLETRTLLTTMLAVDNANHLLQFDSASPTVGVTSVNITGLGVGETIEGIDVRSANGDLYGLGITDNGATRTGQIYTINPTSGAAAPVGTFFSNTLADTDAWGFGFNPVTDTIRIVNDAEQNLRVDPNNGSLVSTDTNLTGVAAVSGIAYSPNSGGLTTLYGLDHAGASDYLVTIGGINGVPSPSGGLTTVVGGVLTIHNTAQYNFDIDASGNGFLTAQEGGTYNFYTINVAIATTFFVGTIGAGATPIDGLTVDSVGTASVVGTGGDDALVVTATGPNSGTYSLNGGTAVPFAGITSFSFLGGAGDDTLTINNPAGSIFAPVNGIYYDGQSSTIGDTLVVQGGGGAAFNETYTPSSPNDGILTTTGPGVPNQIIQFVGLEPVTDTVAAASLTINGTAAADTINVVNGAGGTTQVNSNTFELVNFANKTAVTINSVAGADVVTIDAGSRATGLNTLTVNTGTEADTINLLNNASLVTYNINAGAGADTIHLATAQLGGLDHLPGSIVVDGGSEVDSVDLDDDLADFNDTYTVTSTTVSRAVFGGLTYSTIENLTLDAENTLGGITGNNTINVDSTASGVTTTINAQGGDDTVNVGNASNSLDDIVGPLVLDGGIDINALHLNNSGDAAGPAVTITPTGVAIDGAVAHITATNFQTVDVDVTGAVTITGDAGDNDLVVTATSATDADVQLDGGPVVHLTGVTSLTFNAGAGNDTLTIINPTGTVFAPTGGIFYNGEANTTGDSLTLQGGGGATFNETYAPSTVNNGVLVTTNGVVTQTVTFTGLEPVTDTVTVAAFTINGTAAADTINVVNGPGGTTQVNSNTFELVNFANKTAVTVNGVDGVDVVTLSNTLAAAGLTAFNVNAGLSSGSTIDVEATPAGVVTTLDSVLGS